jgi:hypothetical protein
MNLFIFLQYTKKRKEHVSNLKQYKRINRTEEQDAKGAENLVAL